MYFTLKIECLHKLFGILCGRSVCSSPLINLFNHLYQYGLMGIFYILCYNLILGNFTAQIVISLSIGSTFSLLLCPFDILYQIDFEHVHAVWHYTDAFYCII